MYSTATTPKITYVHHKLYGMNKILLIIFKIIRIIGFALLAYGIYVLAVCAHNSDIISTKGWLFALLIILFGLVLFGFPHYMIKREAKCRTDK
ncbi:MAG: hypothetical protein DRP50_07750 [Thermotoga sp.]|nr:MAG: hypothetical protein DRP50_07750 [Thermotoga sp.]